MRLLRAITVVVALAAAGGCVHPHKLEVLQGNIVTPEMLKQLKPGLTRSQVRFILGTPLISDPFHPERWDYVYLYKKHAAAPGETRQLTVIFAGDALERVVGDMAPFTTADDQSGAGATDQANRPPEPPSSPPSARSL